MRQTKVIPLWRWEDEETYKELTENGWELEGYSEYGRDGIPLKAELIRRLPTVEKQETVNG